MLNMPSVRETMIKLGTEKNEFASADEIGRVKLKTSNESTHTGHKKGKGISPLSYDRGSKDTRHRSHGGGVCACTLCML